MDQSCQTIIIIIFLITKEKDNYEDDEDVDIKISIKMDQSCQTIIIIILIITKYEKKKQPWWSWRWLWLYWSKWINIIIIIVMIIMTMIMIILIKMDQSCQTIISIIIVYWRTNFCLISCKWMKWFVKLTFWPFICWDHYCGLMVITFVFIQCFLISNSKRAMANNNT